MSIPDKIIALFAAITPDDVRNLPKAKRERFRNVLAYWAALADPDGHQTFETIFENSKEACERENRTKRPKSGVLADLRFTGGRQS